MSRLIFLLFLLFSSIVNAQNTISFTPSYNVINISSPFMSSSINSPSFMYAISISPYQSFTYTFAYNRIKPQDFNFPAQEVISIQDFDFSSSDDFVLTYSFPKCLHHTLDFEYSQYKSPFISISPHFIFQYHEFQFKVSGPLDSDDSNSSPVDVFFIYRIATLSLGIESRVPLYPGIHLHTDFALGTSKSLNANLALYSVLPYNGFTSVGFSYSSFSDDITYRSYGPYFSVGIKF